MRFEGAGLAGAWRMGEVAWLPGFALMEIWDFKSWRLLGSETVGSNLLWCFVQDGDEGSFKRSCFDESELWRMSM